MEGDCILETTREKDDILAMALLRMACRVAVVEVLTHINWKRMRERSRALDASERSMRESIFRTKNERMRDNKKKTFKKSKLSRNMDSEGWIEVEDVDESPVSPRTTV